MASKEKCKYWDKCYRKDAAHKKQFLHPSDVSDEDTGATLAPAKKTASKADLKGKKIVFTGALTKATRKNAAARAKTFGCIVVAGISKNVDIVIAGDNAGQKLDRAEELGLRVVDEDDWEEILLMSKPVRGYKASTRNKNRDSAQISDSDDDDYEPIAKKKTIPKVKKRDYKKTVHNVSTSEESDGPGEGNPGPSASPSPTKRRAHDISCSEDDEPSPSKKSATDDREMCKYGAGCYRKDETHLKRFKHPKQGANANNDAEDNDEEEDADDDENDEEIEPLNEMGDGETVDVRGGTYRIKRTGDHYYCTCMAWKNQNVAVDSRTCKHLKEHLGERFELRRCNLGATDTSTGRPVKSPKKGPKAIPQLLLANKWSESTDPTGWWMSEKLDGVRAYWDGSNFYSRLGNPFTPPDWFTENYPKWELDGELFGGRGKFQSTVSIVKSAHSARWKQISYQVFDSPNTQGGFDQRYKTLKAYFDDNDVKTVEVLAHTKCSGKAALVKELKRVENLGGEGLMIRQPNSKYVNGRSNTLLKIKTFHDAEARVIGHEKGKGKNSSRCGALRCEMESGKKFNVGSGLSDKDRDNPPKIGSIITYKFQELTNDGVPRFPSYVGVRIDMDEPKDAVIAKKITDGD